MRLCRIPRAPLVRGRAGPEPTGSPVKGRSDVASDQMPFVGVKFRQWPPLLLAVYLVAGCTPPGSSQISGSDGSTVATATTAQAESPAATVVVSNWIRYTEDALSMLEENHLWRDRIDWGPIRETALSAARMRPTEGGAHQALVAALTSLQDRHTRFVYPPGTGLPDPEPVLQPPVGRNLEGDIGYLSAPAVIGDGPTLSRYATDLHEAMREIARVSAVCGWVVDLRLNTGGYLPPMILGLGPLLGEGVVVTYRGTQEPSSSDRRASGAPLTNIVRHTSTWKGRWLQIGGARSKPSRSFPPTRRYRWRY